jgi:outer membrane protein assembly factor BamB
MTLSLLSGSAGAQPAKPFIPVSDLQALGLTKVWEGRLPLTRGEGVQDAFLVDEGVYVTTTKGKLFSIQADVGLIRWGLKLTEEHYKIDRPAHVQTRDAGGPTLVSTTNTFYVLDRHAGDVLHRVTLPFPPGSPPVGIGDAVFMGGSDGMFYSFSVSHPQSQGPYVRWRVVAGGAVTARPILFANDRLVFASQGCGVYSCRAQDKTLLWAFQTGGTVLGDPFVDEGGVYVASTDRSLYKIQRERGTLLWRTRLPRPLMEGPVVCAHTVYQYSVDNGLVALDSATGGQRWRLREGRRFVAHRQDRDVIETLDGRLEVVHHQTGEILTSVGLPAKSRALVNPVEDAVFLVGGDGEVLGARMDDVPYLRLQEILAAREKLNLSPERAAGRARARALESAAPSESTDDDPFRSRRDVPP